MTHLPPHSKEKGFTPEDDQGEGSVAEDRSDFQKYLDDHWSNLPPKDVMEACGKGGLHEWGGWREFDDGRGGERFCQKCGLGAMGHSLIWGP